METRIGQRRTRCDLGRQFDLVHSLGNRLAYDMAYTCDRCVTTPFTCDVYFAHNGATPADTDLRPSTTCSSHLHKDRTIDGTRLARRELHHPPGYKPPPPTMTLASRRRAQFPIHTSSISSMSNTCPAAFPWVSWFTSSLDPGSVANTTANASCNSLSSASAKRWVSCSLAMRGTGEEQ